MGKKQTAAQYPEHDKLRTIADKSQAIGQFLDWLCDEKRIRLCVWDCGEFDPISTSITDLLAAYFEIDQTKLEAEKQDMLAALQRSARRRSRQDSAGH